MLFKIHQAMRSWPDKKLFIVSGAMGLAGGMVAIAVVMIAMKVSGQ